MVDHLGLLPDYWIRISNTGGASGLVDTKTRMSLQLLTREDGKELLS
jgi:hypothetical protein